MGVGDIQELEMGELTGLQRSVWRELGVRSVGGAELEAERPGMG